MQEIADITEADPEKFRRYLTPEVHFVFYLDMEEDNVICSVRACYGKREFSVGLALAEEELPAEERFRDLPQEEITRLWNGCHFMTRIMMCCTVVEMKS